MGTNATSDLELVQPLSPEHELFAYHVASGLSYRKAATLAGICPDISWKIMRLPDVIARVQDLLAEPAERIRAGLDAEMLMLRHLAATEDLDAEGRANVELRLKLVMSHAKLRGWIVEKKQTASVHLDGRGVPQAAMQAQLAEYLDALEPGARRKIEARVKRLQERSKTPQPAPQPVVVCDAKHSTEQE